MSTPPRTGSTMAAILLAVALTTGACSSDDDEGRPASAGETSTQSPSAEPAPIGTRASIGKVTGKLARKQRQYVRESVRDVVDEWFEAAYVGGDYPRNDFHDAFPGFTAGAREQARHDRRLMSNADAGKRIESVRATWKRVRIDVLAARRKPVGITARFALVLAVTGRAERKIEVRGRLFLTNTGHGWRVFGYDVTRGVAR